MQQAHIFLQALQGNPGWLSRAQNIDSDLWTHLHKEALPHALAILQAILPAAERQFSQHQVTFPL